MQSHTHLKEFSGNERVGVAKEKFCVLRGKGHERQGGCWERSHEEVDA